MAAGSFDDAFSFPVVSIMNIPSMIRAALVVVLAAGILVFFGGTSKMKGKYFGFEAENLNGVQVSSLDSRFADKVLVIDIWGTWCPPCRAEIPHLNDLYARYRDQGLEIVGVAFEHASSREDAVRGLNRFIREFRIEYPILLGGTPSEVDLHAVFPDLEGFGGFPTTLVVDREGKVAELTVGFGPGVMEKLEAAVQASL